MKKLIYFLLLGILLGCAQDDYLSSADRNTISEDGSIPFEELLMLINLKTSDSTYLVVKSIDSVSLYINNYYWTKIQSQSVDTSKVVKYMDGNRFLTSNKLNYLVVADQNIEQPDYSTAGDYATYLNASYRLKPGEYVCLIESFEVTFNDQSVKKYYPYQYVNFTVEENTRSAFVGEIELKIN